VLASALLGEEPPELPVAHLVHLAGLFGINGNRARVALSRMVASGEATTDGGGRYRLAGHLLERQSRQRASRSGRTRPWAGEWRMAVVTTSGSSAEDRLTRRHALTFARLAELREGVWLRPDNVDVHLDELVGSDLGVFTARPDGDPIDLVAHLWDLEGWERRARELTGGLDQLCPEGPADLAPGFELSAAVLRHLQLDPLLPIELLPGTWPGDQLRRRYDQWDVEYRRVLVQWSRST
jgi:phenylacetic acid degradation operon negative regulatory protein